MFVGGEAFEGLETFGKVVVGELAAELFVQVLGLCRKAGLVRLGHVALDGTKLRAKASKHKAMSYARIKTAQADLAAQVSGWLEVAKAGECPMNCVCERCAVWFSPLL